MFCPNCGNQVIEGKKFCMNCGEKLEGLAPSQSDNSPAPEASAQPANVAAPAPEASAQPVNVAAPAPEANPTPVSQPVYTANPAPQPQIQYQVIQQKPKSHAWIIVLVTVLVLAIAAGVTLLILKPWDSGNDSSYSDEDDDEDDDKDKDKDKDDDKDKDKDKDDDKGKDRDDDKVVTAKPVETTNPLETTENTTAPTTTVPVITDGLTFTVNGKNVPLELSGYSYIQEGMNGAVVLGLAGCSNNDAYGVAIAINTSRLEENRSYKFEADSNETMISFMHYNTVSGEESEMTSYGIDSVSGSFVVTGTDSSDNIAVKVEARLSNDGITYDLEIEGKVAYYSDYNKLSEELDSWTDKINGNGGYDDDDDDYYGYGDVKCQSCYDSGICGYCYGLGYDLESGDNNSLCKHCNGSGQCRECDAASSSNR